MCGGGGGERGEAYAASQTTVLCMRNLHKTKFVIFIRVFFVSKGNILFYFKAGNWISNVNYDLVGYKNPILQSQAEEAE